MARDLLDDSANRGTLRVLETKNHSDGDESSLSPEERYLILEPGDTSILDAAEVTDGTADRETLRRFDRALKDPNSTYRKLERLMQGDNVQKSPLLHFEDPEMQKWYMNFLREFGLIDDEAGDNGKS